MNVSKILGGTDRPNKKRSAAETVYESLRDQIIGMDIAPGMTISRNEIAERFKVSQSPVREALQKLEQEGLVDSFPQSKTVVTKIDIENARETQFLRLSIEVEAAKRLAQNPNSDSIVFAKRVLQMQKLVDVEKDETEFTALDRLFHLSLFQAAGIEGLWHLVSGRSGHIDRLRRLNLPDPGKPSQVLNGHEKILESIQKGDADAAETQMREHLSGTLTALPHIRKMHPDFFETET